MKHFTKPGDPNPHAFPDDYSGPLITADMTPISDAELAALLAPSAAQLKEAAKAAIEQERANELAAGVTFNGVLYQSDAAFQAHLTGIVGAINAGIIPGAATVKIRSKGNTIEQLTTAQVKGLAGAVLVHVQSVYAASWAAKDAL